MSHRTAFYIQKYVMRGSSQATTPIIPPTSISFILQAQLVTIPDHSILSPQGPHKNIILAAFEANNKAHTSKITWL